MRLSRRATVAGASASLLFGGAAAAPERVVSLNPCLDSILVRVAQRSQIAALSHFARDPNASNVAEEAKSLPFTYESAEEIVGLRPTLVLTSLHTSLATHHMLERLGVRVELFNVPDRVEASLDDIRRIASLLGRQAQGEHLIGQINQALTLAAPPAGEVLIPALIFQPNGFAAGEDTLPDEMLKRCGFQNVASRYGVRKWGNVGLEALLANPPAILLSGRSSATGGTWAERLLRHPALLALKGRMKVADFPERLLYCGGPTLMETADTLARARRAFHAGRL